MKKFYAIFTILLCVSSAWSQEYLRMISEGTHTVQDIQTEAEAYFTVVGTQRGTGYNPYKRWEYQALRNMDENGMLKSPEFYYQELENYNNYINQNFEVSRTTVGTWEQLGPTSWNQTSGWNPGVGRITSIAIETSNTNHIIVGGESGGVWRTLDGGTTWTVLTDNLSSLIVYSLAIDPNDPTVYFWGSSNGVIFKSTDSGATWNFLADTGSGTVNKILIDPTNSNKMYCSVANGGIFKSTNGGVNWSVISGNATTGYDIEFKPGNTNVVYATGTRFFKSTDGGNTFNEVTGFSTGPKMIGVSSGNSAGDENVVYVIEAAGSVFGGLYKSTDSGTIFNELDHTGKNYFGYSSNADDNSGQAPRDMDITVNPNDVNEVHIAGVLTWRSMDGGLNFDITSQWVPQNAANQNIGYCHADVDILEYVGDKLYAGTDGGIYIANDPSGTINTTFYTDLTSGLGIRQFYKFGISQTDPVVITGGSQDNGTSVMDVNGNWTDWLGADGMESFVSISDNNTIYGTVYYGNLYRSNNGGASYVGLNTPFGKQGNWVTPFDQHPTDPNIIYSGFDQVYRSTTSGASWVAISQNFGANLDELKIAPSNPNIGYASRGNQLYKNGFIGVSNTWSQLSGFSGNINSIAIHPTNPNKIAIATTGNEKVYVSTNGGNNWTSYKFDLPDFSARALVWHDNGEDGLYLGMNYGVYYIDNTTGNSWQPFSNNLPNVIISELEINTANNKIYAASYGRGVWASNVYDASLSLNEFDLNNLSLYPNPANKEINLVWNKSDEVSIRIYNSLGKLMYYSKNQNLLNPHKIDISQFSSGLYFVKVNNDNGVVTKKLIVE